MCGAGNRLFAGLATALVMLLSPALLAAPVVSGVTPDEVHRGGLALLTISGSQLGAVEAITFSSTGISVEEIDASASQILVDIVVGERAPRGTRTMTLSFPGEADVVVTNAFEVVPGDVAITSLDPDSLTRGAGAMTVQIHGLNLDAVDSLAMGEDISVSGFAANGANPTCATASVSVGDTAPAGAVDVVATTEDGAMVVLAGGFGVVPGEVSVSSLMPSSAGRGESLLLEAVGENLDEVDSVGLGSAVAVNMLTVLDPTRLDIGISVREESAPVGTPRNVRFVSDEGEFVLSSAFTVEAGAVAITRIRPNRVTQGSDVDLTVEGRNLDGLSLLDAGEGVQVTSIDALSPVSSLVSVEISSSAAVGLRDVEVRGTHGSVVAQDALQIIERTVPPPQVNYPDVIDVGQVDIGARKRATLVFLNALDLPEEVTLEIVGGDVGDFSFFDPNGRTFDELNTAIIAFTLDPLGEHQVSAEFRPSVRATSSVLIDVSARGESLGGLTLRGTGAETVLAFSPTPPVTIAGVAEGNVGFRQVNTLSRALDRVLIEGFELYAERNNGPFEEAAERTMVSFSEPLAPETDFLFGVTLITMETDYPLGSYEGELWVLTDRPTAPIVPLAFFTTVTAGTPGDTGVVDVGPADDPPDVGPDVPADTGTDAVIVPDAQPDTGSGAVDAGGGGIADTGVPGVETGTGPPPDESGCCTVARNGGRAGGVTSWLAVFALGLAWSRRSWSAGVPPA